MFGVHGLYERECIVDRVARYLVEPSLESGLHRRDHTPG